MAALPSNPGPPMTPSPHSPQAQFGPLVAQTSRQWRRAVDRLLQPYGLTQASWQPLLHLSRSPTPMRQKDLARSLAVDNSSLVRILDTLQREGLLERREGRDRRAKELHLTAAGQQTVARVEAVARQVRMRALEGLAETEIEAVNATLRRVLDTLARLEREDTGE